MKLLYFKTTLTYLLLLDLIILEWTVSDCTTTSSSTLSMSTLQPTQPTTPSTSTKPRPENVQNVTVIAQTETNITLQWEKVNNISTYMLQYNHNGSMKKENVSSSAGASVTHEVAGLTAGTKYNFTIITQLEGATSSGYSVEAATRPLNPAEFRTAAQTETSITLQWRKINGIGSYILIYDNNTIDVPASTGDNVTQVICNLTSMTRYNFRLFAVFDNISSSGINYSAATAPPNVEDVQSVKQTETSITLRWRQISGISSYVLDYNKTTINVPASAGDNVTQVISNLTSMTRYNFRLFAVFDDISSSGINYTALTAPSNPSEFKSISQTETSITLQWKKADANLVYMLVSSQGQIIVSDSAHQEQVTHTVSGLTSGTKYTFSVFAVFETIQSSGIEHTAATVPPAVTEVSVTERTMTSVSLTWNVDAGKGWTYILYFQEKNVSFWGNDFLPYKLSDLQPGTEYNFSVVTNFFELNSKAYKGFIVTTINCSGVNWHVTTSSIQGEVEGLFTNATATHKSQTHVSPGGSNVSFTGLYPGATYKISLLYEKNWNTFVQCNHDLTIIPPVLSARCEYSAAGYSVKIVWNKPPGVWTAVEVNVSGRTHKTSVQEEQYITVSGFQPAKTYQVSLAALSGTVRSLEPSVFPCSTDPRGVIAGSVIAVLLFGVLICIAVFVYSRRSRIISRTNVFGSGTKQSGKKPKAISAAKFSGHFHRLSENDHMGFSEEYENLNPVGREQTQKAALLSENKSKNRFVNILPYDWCRVKLSRSSPDASDYINASYMPGYNNNREYIATQGPLPSTLSDFWQMVWEQRVKGIVMVTNCTEKGRVKCERYWPAVSKPCLYGELLVTTESEQEDFSWTLRTLTLKHRHTSQECTVKHFHFTVWPDHGVPVNTQDLIQFRGLVRQHMQTEGASAPTVVHCSAGVGRTGTIIALDVLLQQLQNEKAVGIYAFVHRMRLHRSNMVQTEPQYVFLHQCIMDCLQRDKTEESTYEDTDVIYSNATALKELDFNAQSRLSDLQ